MQTTFATRTSLHGAFAARRVASNAPLKAAVPRLAVSRRCQVGGTTMIVYAAFKYITFWMVVLLTSFILSRRSPFLLSLEVAEMMAVTSNSSKRETPSILTFTSSVSSLEERLSARPILLTYLPIVLTIIKYTPPYSLPHSLLLASFLQPRLLLVT
jgi:hypothetical protein